VSELGVFLGGEGRNELGSRSGDPAYQSDSEPGVVQTLLHHVQQTGWRVIGSRSWSHIRKLRARGPTPNEQRNVAALLLDATEAGADILAFVRDSDGDAQRVLDIDAAVGAHESRRSGLDVIGGAAIPVLEAWLLAIQGEPGAESLSKAGAKRLFRERNGFIKDTEPNVRIAQGGDLSQLPSDAHSLKTWLNKARTVFAARIPASVRPAEIP
jgi:hypothetical protein